MEEVTPVFAFFGIVGVYAILRMVGAWVEAQEYVNHIEALNRPAEKKE